MKNLPFTVFYYWGDEDDDPDEDELPEYDLAGPAISKNEHNGEKL